MDWNELFWLPFLGHPALPGPYPSGGPGSDGGHSRPFQLWCQHKEGGGTALSYSLHLLTTPPREDPWLGTARGALLCAGTVPMATEAHLSLFLLRRILVPLVSQALGGQEESQDPR